MVHAFTYREHRGEGRARVEVGMEEKVVRRGPVLEMLSAVGLTTMLCRVLARLLLVWIRNDIGVLMVTHPSVLQPDPIL